MVHTSRQTPLPHGIGQSRALAAGESVSVPEGKATDLLTNYDPGLYYDELFGGRDYPAEHSALIRQRLAGLNFGDLLRRSQDAERELYNLGITFLVYSNKDAVDRILPFDIIPRVISAKEWAHLEAGITQRVTALMLSNRHFDSNEGARLYNERLEEYSYVEEVGFDGIMLNEHHTAPFCMSPRINIFAGILAAQTKRVKIVLLGNPLPVIDNPVHLAEELSLIDMISGGRLVSGFVRGGGVENIQGKPGRESVV